jgi:hypothetical protein
VVSPGREQPRGFNYRIEDDTGSYPDAAYAGSYTEKMVRRLFEGVAHSRADGHMCSACEYNTKEAAELLKQYHRDLHIPYEQRDAAREAAKSYKKQILSGESEIKRLYKLIAAIRSDTEREAKKLAASRDFYKSEAVAARDYIFSQRAQGKDHSALVTELKMAHGIAASSNLYDVVSAIDYAISELSK